MPLRRPAFIMKIVEAYMLKSLLLSALFATTLSLTACSTTAPSSTDPEVSTVAQAPAVPNGDPQNGYEANEQAIQSLSYDD